MTKRGPFDSAQDMLCAFARDIPTFGCDSAALALCGNLWMNRLQKPIGGNLSSETSGFRLIKHRLADSGKLNSESDIVVEAGDLFR